MAGRRPPGFSIPLGFYDGPEVKSIPRRIRAAAVGVWALAGTFSAAKLQDGYVDAETLKELGCTDAIRTALMSTRGSDGLPDPLWEPARAKGIQFRKWVKYQRSRAEVNAYREQDAARKKIERSHPKYAVTSSDSKMSDRTLVGQSPDVCEPKTKTETNNYLATYVTEESSLNVGAERGLSEPVQPSASRLVATIIPDSIPSSIRAMLRIKASELIIRDGLDHEVVADALRRWLTKPDAGPGMLPSLAADVVRMRTASAPTSKLRSLAELANEVRAQESSPSPKELE